MELRSLLRSKTAEIHQELDSFVNKMQLFESPIRYRYFLAGMYQLHRVFGPKMDQAAKLANLPPSSQSLSACIRDDIGDQALLVSSDFPAPFNDEHATAWAIGYVMEGSCMGARFMVQTVEALVSKHPDASIDCQYLKQLSQDSYKRWPKFVEALNAADCDHEETVLAARNAFITSKSIFAKMAFEMANHFDQPNPLKKKALKHE